MEMENEPKQIGQSKIEQLDLKIFELKPIYNWEPTSFLSGVSQFYISQLHPFSFPHKPFKLLSLSKFQI